MPYIRIGSFLICSRIGMSSNCQQTWYSLSCCEFPTVTAMREFICRLFKCFNIDEIDVPTTMSATLELWCRMTHSTKLRYDFWQVTMCVIVNLTGKVLDDDWCTDTNGWLCKQLQLNLKAFNKCEATVCAALNYNFYLSRMQLSVYVDEVQTIHERVVNPIVNYPNREQEPDKWQQSTEQLMLEQAKKRMRKVVM